MVNVPSALHRPSPGAPSASLGRCRGRPAVAPGPAWRALRGGAKRLVFQGKMILPWENKGEKHISGDV